MNSKGKLMNMNVIKRDGSKEPLNIEKIHKVVFWAAEGLSGVSASEVELKSQIQFYDNIESKNIHETLIKAASELISEESPNYQFLAGRLINYQLRKEVYGKYEPWHVLDVIKNNVANGLYDEELLTQYTESEWNQINNFINHGRDMKFAYAAMEQLRGKYLVKNRVTGQIFETPQICYVLIAATLGIKKPAASRMAWIKDYYEMISKHYISLPTPIMAGVRTPQRQYSSCCLIEIDDSLKSISAGSNAVISYVSQKAGIGLGLGRIRAQGSKVRNGDTSHTGVTSFYRLFQSSVKSCSQGSIRNGASTCFVPIFHLEIEDILVLKNNKGTEENRVRNMDYGIQFNKLFYERLITDGNITLFSPNDVTDMYEAFFSDQDLFKELYESYEANPNVRKKTISALELFTIFMRERQETGRIYLQNVDNCNLHSSFDEKVAPVRQSNLCMEIALSTVPMGLIETETYNVEKHQLDDSVKKCVNDGGKITGISLAQDDTFDVTVDKDASRIAMCSLSAINWGKINKPSDFEKPCRMAVEALDALLDYQDYPVVAARLSTMEHRPLGIGIINFAYFLAKNGVKYSDDSALALVDEYAEAWSYYLIRASVDLAIEKGACLRVDQTKYKKGVMPIDTRKIDIDDIVPHVERMDWKTLREDAKKYGIRNATLMALMPSETSSIICNATNGIEPPRALVSVKISKDGVLAQVVPNIATMKNKYELLWDQKSPEGYLKLCAVLQKYVEQAISVNTSYHPKFYPMGKIPMSELLGHLLMFYKYGGKNLYYNNINDCAGEIDIADYDDAKEEDETCESCSI